MERRGEDHHHHYSPLMSHGADTRVGEGGGLATALFFLASAGVVEWPGGARWLTDGGPRQREGAMRRARVGTVGARPSQGGTQLQGDPSPRGLGYVAINFGSNPD